MRKFTILALCVILSLSFISCGKDERSDYSLPYYAEIPSASENLIDTPEIMESTIIDKENLRDENKMIIKI